MVNRKHFMIAVEPEFDQVLERIEELAIATQSSRSAIVRNMLYDRFNIPRPASRCPSRAYMFSKRREVQQ